MTKPKKKSLRERRAERLKALSEQATQIIRKAGLSEFTRVWLAKELDVTDREAAQVASQLKKDLVLYGENKMGDEETQMTSYRVRESK